MFGTALQCILAVVLYKSIGIGNHKRQYQYFEKVLAILAMPNNIAILTALLLTS